ncbi:MAG: YbaK/EbsC family protein [Myxococcaceae bacterium]
MVPHRILDYLDANDVPYFVRSHPRAVSAQYLAEALHVSGYEIAKTIVFEADGKRWIGVLPGVTRFNPAAVSELLHAHDVRILREEEFHPHFPDCELGAEPPFGGLFSLPVLMDTSLRQFDRIFVRGGTHEDAIELWTADYEWLERPRPGEFSTAPGREAYPAQSGYGATP